MYIYIYVYINYGHHDLLAGKFDLYMSTLTKNIIIKWLFFVQEIYRTFHLAKLVGQLDRDSLVKRYTFWNTTYPPRKLPPIRN